MAFLAIYVDKKVVGYWGQMAVWTFRSTKSPMSSGGRGADSTKKTKLIFVDLNGQIKIQRKWPPLKMVLTLKHLTQKPSSEIKINCYSELQAFIIAPLIYKHF